MLQVEFPANIALVLARGLSNRMLPRKHGAAQGSHVWGKAHCNKLKAGTNFRYVCVACRACQLRDAAIIFGLLP